MKKKVMPFLVAGIFLTAINTRTATAQSWNLNGNADATTNSKLGTTANVPLKLYTSSKQRMIIDSLGNVGIGTSSPVNLLTVRLNGSAPAASWLGGGSPPSFMAFGEEIATGFNLATAANISGFRPVLNTRRSRGTLASPAAVSNNDYLASFVSSGYDGFVFQNPATIDFYVDGTPSAGNVPGRISFVTGTNAATRLERLKIDSKGDVIVTSGDLIMGSAEKTIQFATPVFGSAPMMTMFPGFLIAGHRDRMILAHSPGFSNTGLQYQDALGKFNFLIGGTSVLTADLNNKRVGIGTSKPTLAKLAVEGMVGNTVAAFRGSSTGKGIALVSDYPGVYFNSYYDAGQKAMAPGYAGILNFDPEAGQIYLGTSATAATAAETGIIASAGLLLDKEGDVGIGITAPTSRLHVVANDAAITPVISASTAFVGDADVRGILSVSKPKDGYGFGIEAIGGYRGGSFLGNGGSYGGGVIGVVGNAIGSGGPRYGIWGTASGGTENWGGYFPTKTYTTELRVGGTQGASGFVAAINGKLIAEEVRIQLRANWPDYVFKKEYKLMPIEELEVKIKADNHLPGIPAASEVKENGLMLGEMQTKAMEKIEEATLYIIQLNNKIKLLDKEKEQQKSLLSNKIALLEKVKEEDNARLTKKLILLENKIDDLAKSKK